MRLKYQRQVYTQLQSDGGLPVDYNLVSCSCILTGYCIGSHILVSCTVAIPAASAGPFGNGRPGNFQRGQGSRTASPFDRKFGDY
jgi:hypothetical protein